MINNRDEQTVHEYELGFEHGSNMKIAASATCSPAYRVGFETARKLLT